MDGGTVVPVTRLINVEDYLDYVSNRVMPQAELRTALEGLWSASAFAGSPVSDARLEELNCAACGIDTPAVLDSLAKKIFMIVIQDFQDPYTLNVKQLMKCCVEEITPDGRLIPFCAYNSVGYREQVRQQLSGVAIPTVVPNATPLQPVLVPMMEGPLVQPFTLFLPRDGGGAERNEQSTRFATTLSENPLEGTLVATPALGEHALYIRTDTHLYVIGH